MADEQIVTSIVAKADLSSLVSEVHRVTASLQQLQRELIASNKSIAASTKVANNAFRDTLVQSGLFSSHFVNLNSDVDKFGKNLDSGRLKLRDYFSTFQTHLKTSKGMIRELAREQVMLENAVLQPLGRNAQGLMQYNVHIPRGLDVVKNKAQLARMELQIFNRALLEGSTSLINWGKNTQWAGRQLTVGLTVPLTMFGTAAAKAFREADQELTRLVKVYGDIAGTSAQELGRIRKDVTATAKELSSAMGVSFKETLALAADVAATGKTGQELISSVKETTRLAVLGEVDRQEAMKATLAIQTAFKANTEELTESINFLNAVENQTSTTLNDLVEAIPKAGTVVKQLGGSVEDLALYITAMREGGVNASEAANALKSGLASMINPTKQTIGVMSDFGIDIMGMVAQNTNNTTGMILDLQKALDGLDPLSKARALEQMFGKFQFARMAALFNNLGKEGSQTLQVMDLMNASASELASVAGRELALVTESASGRFRRAVESLKASLSGIGEQFLDFGTKVLNVFEKIVNFFSNLPGPVQKLLTLFGGLTAIAGPLIMITGVLANFFGYITKGIVLMRSFFNGTKGWKMLTPEMIAAEKAARMVEKSFYSDAAAANVLHTALQKLIFDYASLKTSMAGGVIPVNPTISTTGGRTVIPGIRREVDPASAYAGELETRAMSHINPRDPNNPASLMGVVPGAIPVNRGIGRTPQIYMQERLPDIEGLTSVKGISTGIVSGEAARFHALMATLGMQTQEEVAALKKTIGLGGTVSKELLDTFDDILPITSRIADGAATQSAAIVAELRAGTITVEQAKSRIITLNAQIDAMLRQEIALYAASKGRTIDFTKAPLMDQPVVDANGQFTLRDLYKKEANLGVLQEIGRLRGIRTFGAPYSIETTRLPKFNYGGDVSKSKVNYGKKESFGSDNFIVSGPTSINYDDRVASLPLDGYVVNQTASMDPNNQWIRNIAPLTYSSSGPTIDAAVTPGEIVLGPGIHRDPLLYAAVDAVNNGYNLGGGIINTIKRGYGRSIGSSDLRDLYSKIFRVESRILSSPNWEQEVRLRSIMHDASILHSHAGLTEDEAIAQATKYFDDAWNATYDAKTGLIDPRQWMAARIKGAKSINAKLNALIENGRDDLRNLESYGGVGQTARFRPTSNLLGNFREKALSGKFGGVALFDRVIGSLYPRGFDIEQFKGDEFLPVSEHTIREGLWTDPKTGKQFSMAGNFGMAMLGEREINSLTADIHRATGAARPDQIPLTNAAKKSDIRQQQRRNVDFTSPRMTSGTRQWLLRAIMGRLDPRSYFMPNASRFAYSGYNAGGPIGYRKGGGVVKRNRAAYGTRLRTRYDAMSGKHILTELPDNFPYQIPLGTPLDQAELGFLQTLPKSNYVDKPRGGASRMGGMGMMMGSMAIGYGAYEAGMRLSGGNQAVGIAAGFAGDIASYKIMDMIFNKSKDAAKGGSAVMRVFQALQRLPGPVKLIGVLVTLGATVKKVFDAISNHRETVSLAFGPSANVIEKLNLKFTTLNDTLNATKARLDAFKESGGALYANYTSAGIPGVTLSIKQLSELKEKVTQDFPELIQMFDQAAGSEVSAKAASLKAQFVAGGMDAQEATNIIYALIAASNKASFAIRAIASEGFRSIKDEATAASSAIKTFFTLIQQGNTDQLVASFDTVFNALQAAEAKLIGMKMEQYEIVDAAEAYQLTLERINSSQGSTTELAGDQLARLKDQNPILATILGTSETLASVFAKLRMFSMGISMDFTQLNPQMAQTLSVAIMKMDTFYRTDKTKNNPFSSLVSQIEKAKEAASAADQKTIENAEKKKEDLEELIELKQKEIDAIREEADERRKALDQEQQDEDILLQIKKKQLEYNNALAAGDMQTAAQAQLDIQRLVGQQQTEFAKRAIDEKEKRDTDAKEAEIESLRNQIKSLQDRVQDAQETAKKGAENVAKLEDLLGRSIQAMMMGQGGYEQWEVGVVQGLISELKKSVNPEIKALVPVLENAIKDPEGGTAFDRLLKKTLEDLGTGVTTLNQILGATQTDALEVDKRNFWDKLADAWFKFLGVQNPTKPKGNMFSGGGYLRGPGTGTSDSIPGYITGYADGGAIPIRVSNTEYITRSSSVHDVGVSNMDLINQRGAEGVIMAAQNLLGVTAATGGYVNRLVNYAMGSTGGLPQSKPKQLNFNKLNDRTAYAMRHLVSKGMTPEAAAGIVGNLIAESTLRPGAEEVGHTQEGRGVAQWGVNARWKTYQSWLKKNNKKNIYDLTNQLDFLWWEMHNGQLANPAMFKKLKDITKAAYIFMDQYERPGVLRWKERNTWAYKAYQLYTGKDYANMSRPGPEQAKSDYDKGLSKPKNFASEDSKNIIVNPLNISGVSKLSALGFKSGGYLGFKGGSAGGLPSDGGRYDKLKDYFSKLGDLSVNFKTDRHDLNSTEIAELKQIAQEVKKSGAKTMYVKGYADKRGSIKYNMALSKRRADYVAQILRYLAPGIDFIPMAVGEENSKSSLLAMSKKRRVSIELPPRGYGLSLPDETRDTMGSSPFEGIFPGGGFQGLMTMAKGGYLGFKKGGSPKSKVSAAGFNPFAMGMEWFGNTLSNAAHNVSKFAFGFDPRKPFTEQSGLEKLAMASVLIPGSSAPRSAVPAAGRKISSFENWIKTGANAPRGVHWPSIYKDPYEGANWFVKSTATLRESFAEIYGSLIARKLGIPTPKNIALQGWSDINDNYWRWKTVIASKDLGPNNTILSDLLNSGDLIKTEKIPYDVGRLVGLAAILRNRDSLQNGGNLFATNKGRLGALDFGYGLENDPKIVDTFLNYTPEQAINYVKTYIPRPGMGIVKDNLNKLKITGGKAPEFPDNYSSEYYRGLLSIIEKTEKNPNLISKSISETLKRLAITTEQAEEIKDTISIARQSGEQLIQGKDKISNLLDTKSVMEKAGVYKWAKGGYLGFKGGSSGGLRKYGKYLNWLPQTAMSTALWSGMEQGEKALSLMHGANENSSGIHKWSKALGRVGYNALQGGVSGLPFGGPGFVIGSFAGLGEGLGGLLRSGSQYGVKGGHYSDDKGFDAQKQLKQMTAKNIAKEIAITTAYGTLLAGGLKGVGATKLGQNVSKFGKSVGQIGFYKAHDFATRAKNTLPIISSFDPFASVNPWSKESLMSKKLPIVDYSLLFPNLMHKLMTKGMVKQSPSVMKYQRDLIYLEQAGLDLLNAKNAEFYRDPISNLPITPFISSDKRGGTVNVYTPENLAVALRTKDDERKFLPSLINTFKPRKQPIFKKGDIEGGAIGYKWSLYNPNWIKNYFKHLSAKARAYMHAYTNPHADNPAFNSATHKDGDWENFVAMPQWTGKTKKVMQDGKMVEVSADHRHATTETLVHELGHRDLDVFGSVRKVPGYNPANSNASHEAYADAYMHRAIQVLKTRYPAYYGYLTSRQEKGLGYGLISPFTAKPGTKEFNDEVRSNVEQIIQKIYNSSKAGGFDRGYQLNANWFRAHAEGTRTQVGNIPTIAGYKELADIFEEYGIITGREEDYIKRIKEMAEDFGYDPTINVSKPNPKPKPKPTYSKVPLGIPFSSQLANTLNENQFGFRKFHDWNGVIPGNYGQEVGAILQAGKESVYDTDYINSLRNGTMNSTTSNSKTINVGSIKMEFTEPVTNGKQIFEEFKALVNFENSKSGPSISVGMRG